MFVRFNAKEIIDNLGVVFLKKNARVFLNFNELFVTLQKSDKQYLAKNY
jgi:hypothetical protein